MQLHISCDSERLPEDPATPWLGKKVLPHFVDEGN